MIIDGNKAFVIYRHRDSALKAMNDNDESGLKMKIVSTHKTENREERKQEKKKQDVVE